jgi:hypothetical protein
MRLARTSVCLTALLLLAAGALAQDPNRKHFSKDGLSFDYQSGWTIVDESNSDAQQLTLRRDDSDTMIKLFVHRGRVNSPEKMAQARSKLIDPYVAFTEKQFLQMGAKPERTPASTEIGGSAAEGVRIQAVLGSESGEAAIYWNTVGERLLVLTFFGPDKALKKATPAWDTVRNSLKVEPPPQQKSTPQPSPAKGKP